TPPVPDDVCGISGFLGWGRQPADEQIARRMTATLRHRGPDDEGYYVDGPVALGHRRLRVIAPESGRQPLSNEDGSVWAILNAELGDCLVFGSELRALLAHPCVARELDFTGFASYMRNGYVVDPHTIVRGVQKLPPGHLLTVSGTKTRLMRYWDIAFPRAERRDESEWAELAWDGLCAAVRRRLVADVPLGVFLSGGPDSSSVAAATASVAPARKLATVSMGFTEATYDETPFAREVARPFRTDPHEFACTAANAPPLLA